MSTQDTGPLRSHPEAVSDLSHQLAAMFDNARVGTDQLYARALGKLARFFRADSCCLVPIDPDGSASAPIMRFPQESTWEEAIQRISRPGQEHKVEQPFPYLFGRISRSGKLNAVIVVHRQNGYHRDCRDDMRRLAHFISTGVARHDRLRLVDIQSRIDRRIMIRGHHPKDVLYSLLDELRLLTHYNCLGSLFRYSDNPRSLSLVAEKVIFRSGGSRRIGYSVPLSADDVEFLTHSGVEIYSRREQRWVKPDNEAPPSEPSNILLEALFSGERLVTRDEQDQCCEMSVLLAPIHARGNFLGLLRLSGSFLHSFNDYSISVTRPLVSQTALMLDRLSGGAQAPIKPHVFISYVRDDSIEVDRLVAALRQHHIDVWLDREDIVPGQRWRSVIRNAIRNGSHFIACFSSNYNARAKTYMNEELTLAIEELRQVGHSRVWFVPVLLDHCDIPEIEIGKNETLTDLHYVALHENWKAGFRRILEAIRGERAS